MNHIINVMRAELFKAARKRRTYIFAAMAWLISPAILLTIGIVTDINIAQQDFEGAEIAATVINALASPVGMARINLVLMVYFAGFLTIVLALIAALFMGEERSQNMWKTVLVAQPNRVQTLCGKILSGMILMFFFFLGSILSALLIGGIGTFFLPTSFQGDWGSLLGLYALQWSYCLAMLLFAYLMVALVRNNALGIVSVIFVPSLAENVYRILRFVLDLEPIRNNFTAMLRFMQFRENFENIPKYFLTHNFSAPARFTGLNSAELQETGIAEEIFGDSSSVFSDLFVADLQQASIVMAVYALIFGALLFWRFTRQDI